LKKKVLKIFSKLRMGKFWSGHLITKSDYNIERFIKVLKILRKDIHIFKFH